MKLEPTKVFVPVYNRKPEKDGFYNTNLGYIQFKNGNFYEYVVEKRYPHFWLEEQTKVVLTPEQLESVMVRFADFAINYESDHGHFPKTTKELYQLYLQEQKI